MRKAVSVGAFVLAIILATRSASAGPAEDVAREHARRGEAEFNLGNFDEAIAEYEAAYRAVPDPVLLYNVGQGHRLAGHADKAITAYKSFLRTAPETTPNRAQAQKQIEQLQLLDFSPYSGANQPAPATQAAPSGAAQVGWTDPIAAPDAAESSGGAPIYGKWWFWSGVGAVVVAGVVTAVVLSMGGGTSVPNTPLGNQGAFR
jgi:tetratricopeptide (TPR) repeat protein